jgi:hypothetical protein
MMRISREEKRSSGRAAEVYGQNEVGFSKGRVVALDMFVNSNGRLNAFGMFFVGYIVSLLYQCEAMRWRGATI